MERLQKCYYYIVVRAVPLNSQEIELFKPKKDRTLEMEVEHQISKIREYETGKIVTEKEKESD